MLLIVNLATGFQASHKAFFLYPGYTLTLDSCVDQHHCRSRYLYLFIYTAVSSIIFACETHRFIIQEKKQLYMYRLP